MPPSPEFGGDILRGMLLLPLLFLPLWLASLVISLFLWPSAARRTRSFGRRLAYSSTAMFLGTTLGGVAAGFLIQILCGSGEEARYSCMHAGVFYGILGSVGGLIAGVFVAASHERKVGGEATEE
jgi:hypothetical protein